MISDSSSLIIFAKINKLDILIRLYNKIQITNEIYKEIVEEGLKINAPDAKIIEDFVKNKKIEVINLTKKHKDFSLELRRIYPELGSGESDAIALATQEEDMELIIDESIARSIAKLYKLKPLGSLRILLEAYKKNIINSSELENSLEKMIKNNFRISAEVLNEFWNIFEKIKKDKD